MKQKSSKNNIIELNDFTLKYSEQDDFLFPPLNLIIKKGEVVAIIGRSGAGKTTLLKKISGLLPELKTTGQLILRDGLKVRMVFQEPTLLPWCTNYENIALSCQSTRAPQDRFRKRVLKIITDLGLKGSEDFLPAKLSLGMKQRVNFARAFVCEPDLLLMDEPFSGLDDRVKARIMKLFKKEIKDQGMTVIFVTHNLNEANFFADRIMKIK